MRESVNGHWELPRWNSQHIGKSVERWDVIDMEQQDV